MVVMSSPWAREYLRTPGTYIWGTAPSSLAREMAGLLPPRARVLDLGCGEGRDTVFFAASGHRVAGLDISHAGLHKGARLAAEHRVRVAWVAADVERLPLRGAFDLVYSSGALHYVPRARRARLFDALKRLTPCGGHHALVVFTDRLIYAEKGEVIDYFTAGELEAHYTGWRVIRLDARLIPCAQDGTRHQHSVEELIARSV